MEEKQISQTQLCALLWAGLMAPAAELLPAVTLPIAGRGAWLSALAALPVLLLLGWGLGRLGLRHGGLAGAIRWGLGPVVGRLALLLYFIWGELLLALRLRLCAQRLIASGERDGSLWFFLPAAALLVLWMARGKLSAFARAGQVFLAVLLTAAGAVLLLSLPQVRGEHLLPLWWGDALPVLRSTVPLLGVLGYGVFAAFLLGDTEPSPRRGRGLGLWAGGGCLLLGAEQAVVIGNLGPELARRLNSPFFALAKSVGVEGAFQRGGEHHRRPVDLCGPVAAGGAGLCPVEGGKADFSQGQTETGGHGHPHPRGRAGDRRLSGGGDGGRLRPGDRPAGQPDDGAGAAAFGAGRVLGAGDVPSLPTFCV